MAIRLNENTKKNLHAFTFNFGNVRIEKISGCTGYYVYYPENAENWIQYCYNQDYLSGWLYGAVQCRNMFPLYEKQYKKTETEDK